MIDLNLTEDISLVFKGKIGKRRCVRVFHESLFLIIENLKGKKLKLRPKDFNTYGAAFYRQKDEDFFVKGEVLKCTVIFKGKVVVKDIDAKIVRVTPEIVACEFVNLSRKNEYKLDELVLKIQKEQISKIKQKKDK